MVLRPFSFLILFILYQACVKAQDTVRLRNGNLYVAEVVEIGDDYLVYKKYKLNNANDSLTRTDKAAIHSVKYKNGYEDVFQLEEDQAYLDFVKFTNATEMKGRIIEVEENLITFKLSSYTADSIKYLAIDSIAYIKYSNGYLEKYNDIIVRTISGNALNASIPTVSKPDTVRLAKGNYLAGFVSEIGEESISLASLDELNSSVKQILKSDIARIVYGNGYIENYNGVTEIKDTTEHDNAAATPQIKSSEKSGKSSKAKPGKDKKEDAIAVAKIKFASYDNESLKELPVTYSLTKLSGMEPIRSLNLSGNSLASLDNKILGLKDLLVLNLSINKFKEIPRDIYSLRQLYELSLDSCFIRKINDLPKDIDSNSLARLSVCNNRISSVDGSLFLLPNLQYVDLSQNEIKNITNVSKTKTLSAAIAVVDLSSNRLKTVPTVLSRLPGLTTLSVRNNQLKSIDFLPFQKGKLESLDVSNNPLSSLEKEFFALKTLKFLNLAGTRISQISDSISKLTELGILFLPEKLKALPQGLKNNKNLKELYIENNLNITGFPTTILDLSRLESLNMNDTKIYNVPSEIGKLRRLKSLSLSNCGLSSVPASLFELQRLQYVNLSRNSINSISGELNNLPQLEEINFESSPLNEESLMKLKKALTYARIKYYSPELGMNYESKPIRDEFQTQFLSLLEQCNQGSTNACYELGQFFEKTGDYGLAIKLYYKIGDELTRTGSAQNALAYYNIAEMYDDVSDKKSYVSIYKRRSYSDYSDYSLNKNNNRSLLIYCKLCEENAADKNAYKVMQQACAKAALIYNDLQKNLKNLYDFKRSEVERLVGGAGNMANLAAGGDYLTNTATTSEQSVAGGVMSIIGIIGKSAKETKAEKFQKEALNLKEEIEKLRELEEYYLSVKK